MYINVDKWCKFLRHLWRMFYDIIVDILSFMVYSLCMSDMMILINLISLLCSSNGYGGDSWLTLNYYGFNIRVMGVRYMRKPSTSHCEICLCLAGFFRLLPLLDGCDGGRRAELNCLIVVSFFFICRITCDSLRSLFLCI